MSAIEIKNQFMDGKKTAVQIVEETFSRIDKTEPKIGAFLTLLKDRSLEKAKDLDSRKRAGHPLGKLAGVPIAIKDNIHIKGVNTTCASKFLTNFTAPFDATVTRLLEDEGAILIGKTNLDEFAMGSSTENSALQLTKNPWDTQLTPGGSSGGSAAAVAARICPLSLGSDTGGSVRQPASLCGIVGFKPTYGRVSRYGLVAFGSSLDQIAPFATNVKDAALIMEVIGKPCEKDSTSLPKEGEEYLSQLTGNIQGMKIGVPWHFLNDLKDEPKENFKRSIETLKELGAEIIDIDLEILRTSIPVYYILATAEASTNLARFDGIRYGQRSKKAETLDQVYDLSKEEGFGPEVKRRILMGTYVLSSGYQDAYYRKAQKVRTLIIEQFARDFKSCDLIAMPTTPDTAFPLGAIRDPLKMYLEDIYTIAANLAGLPAISIVNGFNGQGMPYGLQLLGPQAEDVRVMQGAYAFEQATQYHLKTPSNL
ncbi:MAG: Asp-tRNA(Asn)/Glu-tRNA(Gln) amidotransferase subunit GatA [Waddliaceae bacterium]